MGGKTKLFLPYQGGTFLDHLLNALTPLPRVLLSVNNPDLFQAVGLPLVMDRWPDSGPMGGICSALEQVPEDALFVTACDMPHLDRGTVEEIMKRFVETGVLTLGRTESGVQPLLGVYPRSMLPVLQGLLAARCLRMKSLLDRVPCETVLLGNGGRAADNINFPAEYNALLQEENLF